MSKKQKRIRLRAPRDATPTQRHDRRSPRRVLSAVGILICVVGTGWWLTGRESAAPFVVTPDQNVLLITIDTLRADALGSYGGRASTPNIDELARTGRRFTFAHAHAVVTLPSHASILTGRYPFQHGVRDNAGFRLTEENQTLSELARAAGLATGAFVGAFPLDRQFGLAQGFDVYDDVGGRQQAQGDFAFTERRAEEVVRAATTWIERQPGRWFAWVHVFDPHAGYTPPPPFDTHYPGDGYAGEVAYVDHALGPLLDLARRAPRPTTVILTADHGEGLGEHGEQTHGVFAYEATLRVPLILAQIGGTTRPRQGRSIDAPVGHIDILPTISGLLEWQMSPDLPGRTLLDAHDDRRVTYFEAMTPALKRGWAPLQGVIEGRDKYVDLPIQELYDLAADSREQHNLVARKPDRVQKLTSALRGTGATLPGEQQAENADVRARLQALGYVSGSAPRKARYTEEDDPKRLIDVDRLMMDGIELYRAGRSAEAMDAYRRVIERRPDMGLAYRRLAFLQWETGATSDAITTLRRGLQKTGPDIDLEIRLGTYLAETETAGQAVRILERVTTADPENTEALNALGIAYARAGRTGDGLAVFERVLAKDPRDAFALENIGTVHLSRNDIAAARTAFTRAIQNDPRSSRAHSGLGVVALQTGFPDEAIAHWRRAVEFDRTNYDALYNLCSELLNAGRTAEARPFLMAFVRNAPRAFYGREIERFGKLLGGNIR